MGLFGPPNVEKMKAKRDVKGLIKAMGYEKDATVRKSAVEALGEIRDEASLDPLINALKDSNKYIRKAAAEALGKIGDARAVEPLIVALKNSERLVLPYASEALSKIGALAVEPLIAALKDSDDVLRQYAVDALAKIGDVRAVESLIATLRDDNMKVRKHAAEALGKIGDVRAIEPLKTVLKDKHVRKHALDALGKLGWQPDKSEAGAYYWIALGNWNNCVIIGASAIEPLITTLDDPNWDIRASAARALVSIYRKAALSEEDRLRILSKRDEIISPRKEHDDSGDNDCGNFPTHTDRYVVRDGLDFPL
ncbi:MAG: HEAT repeat domain-containing protein [Chloroflexi bacterium]|nr:HEAT repeat domain-containing protein [Chloroflexota bacterium]